jgi:hypothetical protein
VAEKFDSATVIGVDLSSIQPSWAPVNVEWRIDDIEGEWSTILRDSEFIHCRGVLQTVKNARKILISAYRFVFISHDWLFFFHLSEIVR